MATDAAPPSGAAVGIDVVEVRDGLGLGGVEGRRLVEGGTARRVEERPTGSMTSASRYRAWVAPDATTTGLPWVAQTFDGEILARIALPQYGRPMAWVPVFSQDGRRMLSVIVNSAVPLRVLPVAGGVPRQLGEAWGSETPLG